jgi:pyruvate kinase
LVAFIRAGMTGIRINLSHGPLDKCDLWLENLAKACEVTQREIDILIDLQGPELRLSDFDPVELFDHQLLSLGEGEIALPDAVMKALKADMMLSVDDGAQQWRVLEADGQSALEQVLRGGMLLPRKSIALPTECRVDLPSLCPQDYQNMALAAQLGIHQIMMPFVHSAGDIMKARSYWQTLTETPLEIFAKIEDQDGLAALPEFVDAADVIVIARGDLGSHIPLPMLPLAQREISECCQAHQRPFLVVTQMLHSMMQSPFPTRAEVTDIAYAVWSGADYLMLTGETAIGDYPIEAMECFVQTASNAYQYSQYH